MAALVTRDSRDADLHKGLGVRKKREQHAVDNQELEDSFQNLYLDEDGPASGAPGT